MNLLVISSRPSDAVEMIGVGRALANAGHHVTLLFLYSPADPAAAPMVPQLQQPATRFAARCVEWNTIESSGRETWIPSLETGARRLAAWLRGRSSYEPDMSDPLLLRKTFAVLRVIDLFRTPRLLVENIRRFWSLRESIGDTVWQRPGEVARTIYQATTMIAKYNRYRLFFDEAIERASADATILPEDIVGSVWPVAIRSAHDHHIPAVVLPYTLANHAEAFRSLRGQADFQAVNNRIAADLYPVWRLTQDGADLVRLPSAHIFAHEAMGITPRDPWMMNSGFADVIAVDSQASFDYFRAGGIPAEQMQVVGSVSQDEMYRRRQQRQSHLAELRQELQVEGSKPMLLVSGCPNQLAATVPYSEFKTMEELAEFVGAAIAPLAAHYHLVVRPHPNFPEFAMMLTRFGFASTMNPTASLVPLADVFVAFASATIRWAIACGIPTVNYDVFHYQYGDFDSARGVVTVTERDAFQDAIRSLTPGSAAIAAQASRAAEDSAYWSVLDGRGLERIEQEIQSARARAGRVKEQQQNA